MCSQGAFGGELRCPIYARDLPRPQLIETLKAQFIRRGFMLHVPADAFDEEMWSADEVSVFFQSGGSVKPRSEVLADAARHAAGLPPEGWEAGAASGGRWRGNADGRSHLELPGPASIAGPGVCGSTPFSAAQRAPLCDRWGGTQPLNDRPNPQHTRRNGVVAATTVMAGPPKCGFEAGEDAATPNQAAAGEGKHHKEPEPGPEELEDFNGMFGF
jgi:hypothetical protein